MTEEPLFEDLTDVETPAEEPETRLEALEKPAPRSPVLRLELYSWALPLTALLALLVGLLGGYLARPWLESRLTARRPLPTEAAVPRPTPDATVQAGRQALMEALIAQTKHFLGDSNAPVTIIEFSDFQCPYCGRFYAQVEPRIRQEYVDRGIVRLGYWHFAFLGAESQWAAEASECAAEQGAFWEYHDYLFEHQNGENKGAFSKDNLKQFAADLELDTVAFNECLDSGRYADLVQSFTQMGRQIGVQSTPTFVVNGVPVLGAQPFEAFQQVIESQR